MECVSRKPLQDLYGDINLLKDGILILDSDTFDSGDNKLSNLPEGNYSLSIMIPKRILGHGTYNLTIGFASPYSLHGYTIDDNNEVTSFQVTDVSTDRGDKRGGFFSVILPWKLDEQKS